MENDIFRLFSIPNIKVYVDTFWFFNHCMKDNFFNAHIMVRMLAIDCYYGKNSYGWDWYNKMQYERVKDNPLVPKHMAYHEEEFKKLILSFEKKGFDENYPIIVNNELLFIDGAHRLALALHFGIKRIPISIDSKYYYINNRDYSFEWFKNHGMDYVKEQALLKYKDICKNYGDD